MPTNHDIHYSALIDRHNPNRNEVGALQIVCVCFFLFTSLNTLAFDRIKDSRLFNSNSRFMCQSPTSIRFNVYSVCGEAIDAKMEENWELYNGCIQK